MRAIDYEPLKHKYTFSCSELWNDIQSDQAVKIEHVKLHVNKLLTLFKGEEHLHSEYCIIDNTHCLVSRNSHTMLKVINEYVQKLNITSFSSYSTKVNSIFATRRPLKELKM